VALDFILDVIKPNPGPDGKIGSGPQYQFLEALTKFRFILYGGAAGGGKSYILRWGAIWFLIYMWKVFGVKKGKVALFCTDYPSLIDRQVSHINATFPKWLGQLHDTQTDGYVFELHEAWGGGMVMLRNLDNPKKYDSVEFMGIFVDELTENPERGKLAVGNLFDELRKRVRWPDLPPGTNLPFAAGTNPGGKGHGWVKRYWIDNDFPPELKPYAKTFTFIQAKSTDNPHNPSDYYAWLLSLPEPLRSAYAEGHWELFQGQFFQEWRTALHVCKPFSIPTYWKRFTAMDWGYAAPACVLWFAVSPEARVFVYRELYEQRWTNEQLAKKAKALTGTEVLSYRELDPSCFPAEKETQRGKSDAEQLAGFGWPCTKAANDRQSGWSQVRDYLHWERNAAGVYTRLPMVQVFENCTNLVRTMPTAVYDAHDTNDLDTDGEDHAIDTLRYGLMSRPPVTHVPLDQMPEEYANAARRAEHDEKEARH
jgi:hypothetical protein